MPAPRCANNARCRPICAFCIMLKVAILFGAHFFCRAVFVAVGWCKQKFGGFGRNRFYRIFHGYNLLFCAVCFAILTLWRGAGKCQFMLFAKQCCTSFEFVPSIVSTFFASGRSAASKRFAFCGKTAALIANKMPPKLAFVVAVLYYFAQLW